MKCHLHTAVRLSVTIVVSDEELEVQVERGGPKAEHDLEDDLGWDHVDNYENSKSQWGIGGLKLRIRPFYLFSMM